MEKFWKTYIIRSRPICTKSKRGLERHMIKIKIQDKISHQDIRKRIGSKDVITEMDLNKGNRIILYFPKLSLDPSKRSLESCKFSH